MESKCKFASVLAVICIVLLSCGNGDRNVVSKDSSKVSAQTMANISFVPDTTVNFILSLNNEASLSRFIPNDSRLKLTESLRENPVFVFLNKGKDEFLLAYQYEGGIKNNFSAFEFGYVKDLKQKTGVATSYNHFVTESGLKLGDSIGKVLSIKGTEYLKKSDSTIVYELSDYDKSKFLKFHNMPAYSFKCSLLHDRITGIRYGFIQP